MRLIGKSFFITAMAVLFLAPLGAQDTLATGWAKADSFLTHAGLERSIATGEVSAGWDFDKDGNKEFLVIGDHSYPSHDGDATAFSVWLYEGSSTGYELVWSWFDTSLNNTGSSFPAHAVGDLDGDNNLELLVGVPYGTDDTRVASPIKFYVWEADANGLPTTVGDVPSAPTPTAVWDLGTSATSNTRPAGMAVGDIDGDGRQEVAMSLRAYTDAATNDAMMIFSLEGEFIGGGFTQWNVEVLDTLSDVGSVYYVNITDLDHDGNLEAFFPTDYGNFFEGTGTADTYTHYTDAVFTLASVNGGSSSLWSIKGTGSFDVDDDGFDELVIGDYNDNGHIFLIDGVTDLATADSNNVYDLGTLSTGGIRGLAVGDFDQDGNADIFVGGNYDASVWHMEYSGTGAYTDSASWDRELVYRQEIGSPSRRAWDIGFGGAADNNMAAYNADLDGNGKPDLVVGYLRGDSATQFIVVLENTGSTVAIEFRPGIQLANAYRLSGNYPNPFNPSTTLDYSLTKAGRVEIVIYDLLGQEVNTLVARDMQPGEYSTTWNGLDQANNAVASGVYFARMKINGAILTTRMTLLK